MGWMYVVVPSRHTVVALGPSISVSDMFDLIVTHEVEDIETRAVINVSPLPVAAWLIGWERSEGRCQDGSPLNVMTKYVLMRLNKL